MVEGGESDVFQIKLQILVSLVKKCLSTYTALNAAEVRGQRSQTDPGCDVSEVHVKNTRFKHVEAQSVSLEFDL